MVCIAAFIILAIIGIFVAILSVFKPKLWKSYTKALKKAWGCLWTKVRLQKCETGFKDDVKNTLLSKVMLSHPKWVKPLSIIIEIVSVIIVVVVVWAILTSIKSLLALWALGSCNVTKPSACSLGAEVCSIDESEPKNPLEATGRWFTEWGEIFAAIPDKFHTYSADDYELSYITIESSADSENAENSENKAEKPIAVDIFDPGCSVCMISYRSQKESGFFDSYTTRLVPFAIQAPDDSYKFKNSELIVRYIFATESVKPGASITLIDRIFTGKNHDGISYQNLFNENYSHEQAENKLVSWLKAENLSDQDIKAIKDKAYSEEITNILAKNREIVEHEIKVKGIPTMLYNGAKHTGLYKAE